MDLKKQILLGITITIVFMAGCISNDFEGKYLNEENPKYYIEIYKDGTFYGYACSSFFSSICSGVSGKWKKQGEEIIFSTSWGAAKSRLEGDAIIDEGGKRWIKEGKYVPFEKRYEYEGKYLRNNNPDYSLELHKDHTYTKNTIERYIRGGGIARQYREWGTWKIEENKMVFTVSGNDIRYPAPGNTYSYEIKEEDGQLKLGVLLEWIKQ